MWYPRIRRKYLLVAAIPTIAIFIYEAYTLPRKRDIINKRGIVRHHQTLRVSHEVQMKILRVVNSEVMTEMEEPRPLYKYVLEPTKTIQAMKSQEEDVHWTAVNMIKSAAANRDRRDAIRITWGSVRRWRGVQLTTIFIVGNTTSKEEQEKVEEEFHKYGDILQIVFEENYKRISSKTLAGMQWATEILPSNWLYSSGDDDVALHVANFVRFINFTAVNQTRSKLPLRSLIELLPIICIHRFAPSGHPKRSTKSKWFMPKELYSEPKWPPYCAGGWYSAPVTTVARLYSASRLMPFLHLDDVWITGLMRIRMLAASGEVDEKSLLTAGIYSVEFLGAGGGLPTLLSSHKWGNTQGVHVNISQSLTELWKKWKTALSDNKENITGSP